VRHVEDDDIAGRLEDLELAVVQVARDALQKAARVRIEILRRGIGMVREDLVGFGQRPWLIRDLSVRRIDDEALAAPRRVRVEILIQRLKLQILDVVEGADRLPEPLEVRLAVRRSRRDVSAGGRRVPWSAAAIVRAPDASATIAASTIDTRAHRLIAAA